MKVAALRLFFLAVLFVACDARKGDRSHRVTENLTDSVIKVSLHMYVDSCWNKGDTTFLSQVATYQFERKLNGILVTKTKKEMQAHMEQYFNAFPDLHLKMKKFHILDNTAFIDWTCTGTHTGKLGETAATGKKVKIHGFSQLFFNEDGNMFGEEVVFNELDLLQQLGYTMKLPNLK
ncbi:ester cyclase [Pareuzebyella sediminis]|uniref:ester cyclase n=1 Tax=Pareuzebyella sediminis TaxID=2607998 RepID=UPI0011EE7340|nr:ester cyclase [Pareuzebyella sediminis]